MIVLGFDTATAVTSVGLRLHDGRVLRAWDDPPPGARPGHATQLLALSAELLARAGLSWSEIERIAVGLGPGTFTGLRVGVASAHGLARSLRVELVGVSTLRALALSAAPEPDSAELGVLSVIDARRGEAFIAAYTVGDEGAVELLAPAAVAPTGLAEVLEQARIAAPGVQSWAAVGDGAVRFRAPLGQAGADLVPDGVEVHRVDAGSICELALSAHPAPPSEIVPDYRRRPDAEITLEGAGR